MSDEVPTTATEVLGDENFPSCHCYKACEAAENNRIHMYQESDRISDHICAMVFADNVCPEAVPFLVGLIVNHICAKVAAAALVGEVQPDTVRDATPEEYARLNEKMQDLSDRTVTRIQALMARATRVNVGDARGGEIVH